MCKYIIRERSSNPLSNSVGVSLDDHLRAACLKTVGRDGLAALEEQCAAKQSRATRSAARSALAAEKADRAVPWAGKYIYIYVYIIYIYVYIYDAKQSRATPSAALLALAAEKADRAVPWAGKYI